eukprot:Em0011g1189a
MLELSSSWAYRTRDLSVEEYKQALSQALSELASMREAVKELFKEDQAIPPKCVAAIEQEDGYFSTYTHFSIHEEMLKVVVYWMLAVVLGSCLCLQLGLEQRRENGLDNKVTLVKGAMEEVQLPVEKFQVDVIISEWMGYCLLFESMLDTVIVARDRWLLDASQVYPNVCSISLVAMGSKTEYDSRVCFWDDVYGCKMTAIKEEVFHEAHVHCVQPHDVISTSDVVKRLNLATVKVSELGFKSPFTLTMLKGHHVPLPSLLGTGPMDTPTHWKQTVFYLNKPAVQTGDLLTGTIEFRKNKSDTAQYAARSNSLLASMVTFTAIDLDDILDAERVLMDGATLTLLTCTHSIGGVSSTSAHRCIMCIAKSCSVGENRTRLALDHRPDSRRRKPLHLKSNVLFTSNSNSSSPTLRSFAKSIADRLCGSEHWRLVGGPVLCCRCVPRVPQSAPPPPPLTLISCSLSLQRVAASPQDTVSVPPNCCYHWKYVVVIGIGLTSRRQKGCTEVCQSTLDIEHWLSNLLHSELTNEAFSSIL